MATEAAEQQYNGTEQPNGDCEFNPDAVIDDDDQKIPRPPDIDADVRDMERRRRVESMMNRYLVFYHQNLGFLHQNLGFLEQNLGFQC